MKKSELRQLINEELKKTLKEVDENEIFGMWEDLNNGVEDLKYWAKQLKNSKLKRSADKMEKELELIYDLFSDMDIILS